MALAVVLAAAALGAATFVAFVPKGEVELASVASACEAPADPFVALGEPLAVRERIVHDGEVFRVPLPDDGGAAYVVAVLADGAAFTRSDDTGVPDAAPAGWVTSLSWCAEWAGQAPPHDLGLFVAQGDGVLKMAYWRA